MKPISIALGLQDETEDDYTLWNKSVKLATMLYYWKLVDSYETALQLILCHQRYLRQEQFKPNNTLLAQLEEQLPDIEGPRIWACFHIGPYALMARALIRQGYGIAVLIKDEVFDEQYSIYIEQFKESFGREPKATELQFVRSSGSNSLIKLKHLLKKGFHVICYIDGEEGGEGEKGWTTVQLSGQPLNTRIGMAMLSQWSNIPIRPIVLTIRDRKLAVHSKDDFQVGGRDELSKAMQYCYGILEELHLEEIMQWEFAPKLLDRLERTLLSDNSETPIWLPIYLTERKMLFDIVSGSCKEVSTMQFKKMDMLRRKFLNQFH